MKRKIVVGCIGAVLLLMLVGFTSVVAIRTTYEIKESPLFGVRLKKAINDRIKEIKLNLESKFIVKRIFLFNMIPIKDYEVYNYRTRLQEKVTGGGYTACPSWNCICLRN